MGKTVLVVGASGLIGTAAVDAFLDYTRNPFNPMGRILPKQEALDTLHAQGGILFDPVVVDALITLQSGDLLKQRVETDGRQIYIADPDEATRTDLMDAVSKRGGHRVAVVVFAARPKLVCPLTTDYDHVRARP